MSKSIIAEKTKEILDKRGLKQCAFAVQAGYTPAVFSNMMCGRKVITADDAFNIACKLGVEPNALFGFRKEE